MRSGTMRDFRQLAYCVGGTTQRHVGIAWMVIRESNAISDLYSVRICAAVSLRRMALRCVPRLSGASFSYDIDGQSKRDASDLVPFLNRAVARGSQSGYPRAAFGITAISGALKE